MWCDLIGSYWILFLNFSLVTFSLLVPPCHLFWHAPVPFPFPFRWVSKAWLLGHVSLSRPRGTTSSSRRLETWHHLAWTKSLSGAKSGSSAPWRREKWDFQWNKRSSITVTPLKKGRLLPGGRDVGWHWGWPWIPTICCVFFPLFWNFGNPIW